MIKNFVRGIAGLTVLSAALLAPLTAQAAPLVSWSISGPGTTSATQVTATAWELDYLVNDFTGTWTATATAVVDGDYEFAWTFSGFHGFFNVTAYLMTFNDASVLVNAGPESCGACNPPSGGFVYSGVATFSNVLAGETFGFTFGGNHFTADPVMTGTLALTQAQDPNPVAEPAMLLLLGSALAAGARRARRKTAA